MPGVFLVKAIRPKKKIDGEGFNLAILSALNDEGEICRRMYKQTTRTWKSPKPVFKLVARIGKGGPRGGKQSNSGIVEVYTTDQVYQWVDFGTKGPYPIVPKRGPYLRFLVGGSPKTHPRVIGSGAGSAGNQWVTKRIVYHPGIRAREFTDEIRKRRRPYFYANMKRAIAKAQRKYAW